MKLIFWLKGLICEDFIELFSFDDGQEHIAT